MPWFEITEVFKAYRTYVVEADDLAAAIQNYATDGEEVDSGDEGLIEDECEQFEIDEDKLRSWGLGPDAEDEEAEDAA